MSLTFEERVGAELDGLHAGALFLAGDDPVEAEDLLTASLVGAFRRWGHEPGRPDLPRLMRGELARAAQVRERAGNFGRSAGRAALWLVSVERWRHADAAGALGLDAEALRVALREQRAWMRSLLEADRRVEGSGT